MLVDHIGYTLEKVNKQFGQVSKKGPLIKWDPGVHSVQSRKLKAEAQQGLKIVEREIASSVKSFDKVMKQYNCTKSSFKSLEDEIVDLTGEEEEEEKKEYSSNNRSKRRKLKK